MKNKKKKTIAEWLESEEGKKVWAKIAETAQKEREELEKRLQVSDEDMRKKVTI